ncbi:MAG: metal ABC transporter permease [Nitrospirota bacterium]
MSIWEALPILQNGLAACVITALVCSFLGVYVVLKRVVFVTAALSQTASLGIAGAMFLGAMIGGTGPDHIGSVWPIVAAVAASCGLAAVLAFQHAERRLTRESLLGVGYIVPSGIALLLLDYVGGATHDIENLLFGNAVFVSTAQVLVLALVAAVVLGVHALLYKEFVFVAFDLETAKASGMRTGALNQALFASIGLTIAVTISSVGALPVFAFMVVPSAAALLLTRRLAQTFVLSAAIGVAAALIGFYASFQWRLPTGPAMIAVASAFLVPGVLARRRSG